MENIPCWDLSGLYKSKEELLEDLKSIEEESVVFEEKFRGNLENKDDPCLWLQALEGKENILIKIEKAESYADLAFRSDTREGSFKESVIEKAREIINKLSFVEFEIIKTDENIYGKIIESDQIKKYAYHLSRVYASKPHVLPAEEERILSMKDLTSFEAFARLFDEIASSWKFSVSGKDKLTQSDIFYLLASRDESLRKEAFESFSGALKKDSRIISFILNNVLLDSRIKNDLRHYELPESSRHIKNNISQKSVDAMAEAVTANFDISESFYEFKKQFLGLDEFHDFDIYASLAEEEKQIPFDKAKEMVLKGYEDFSPEAGRIANEFFENRWIDAQNRPFKRNGAFCVGIPGINPYLSLNYTGSAKDIKSMAHELGHGIHFYLEKSQSAFNFRLPKIISEMASSFGELVVFDYLAGHAKDREDKIYFLSKSIENIISAVFERTTYFMFEREIHQKRKEGELSVSDLNQIWMKNKTLMFGKSAVFSDDYRYWWIYLRSIIKYPFYSYAYPFGQLLALEVFAQYKQNKEVALKYMDFLKKGGSEKPADMLKNSFNINIEDKQFWDAGLKYIRILANELKSL